MRVSEQMLLIAEREVSDKIASDRPGCFDVVADAYATHTRGDSVLPASGFLRLPSGRNRIISLPAYLGGRYDVAGVKWIASFPGNTARGMARASAVLVLNDTETGFPLACLGASAVSAARTAGSALLAAERLLGSRRGGRVGMVGTGRIANEIARFMLDLGWEVDEWRLFDTDPGAAALFAARLGARGAKRVATTPKVDGAFAGCDLVFIATIAAEPHLHDLALLADAPVVIHLSLRDLDIELITASLNYTDDPDHAFREGTSLQLAEEAVGHRRFLRGTISDLMAEDFYPDQSRAAIFSPFGLGVLDLAVGKWVYDAVVERGGGLVIDGFVGSSTDVL